MTTVSAMRLLSVRGWIIGVLAATLLLSGCSALRIGYNQAPLLSYWWLDAYADFDSTQSKHVREALAQWFRWHRSAELPEYATLLAQAGGEVGFDAQPAQVCRWAEVGRERARIAFEHAVPALASVALSLSPEQLKNIERRNAKTNADFKDDYLQETPEERVQANVKRTLERAEMLYGRLDAAQQARIAKGIAASPFDAELWMAERRARQLDTLAVLRRLVAEKPSPAVAQDAVRELEVRYEHSPREAWRAYDTKLLAYNCRFIAELHNAMHPPQREAAMKRLKGWEEDLRALAAQAEP